MQKDFQKLSRAEIERADKAGELLGRNDEVGRILDYVGICGGYQGYTQKKAISRMLYIDEPPESQPNRKSRETDRGETYGSGRWERLRRGTASFHIIEATFVHEGLRITHGEEWVRAFPAEELVKLTFSEFLSKAATLGLPWPDGVVPPSVAMQIIWESQKNNSLSIRPVAPDAPRLGGSKGSKNRDLRSVETLPLYKPGDSYMLQIRGAEVGTDQLFVFEASQDDVKFEGGNETYCGFPTRLFEPQTVNTTLKSDDDEAFEFFEAKGNFAFIAISFPKGWDFLNKFRADPTSERWSRGEVETFIRALRRLQHEKPNTVRVGWYGYKVE